MKEIIKLCPTRVLLVFLYKMPIFDSVDDFLQISATVRDNLKKNVIVDNEYAVRMFFIIEMKVCMYIME